MMTVLLASLLSMMTAGCGSAEQKEPEAVSQNTEISSETLNTETEIEASAFEEINSRQMVRILLPDRSEERWETDGRYLEDQLRNAGFDTVTSYAEGDADVQIASLQEITEENTDLLIVVPVDESRVNPVLAEVSGVPVILYDMPVSDMSGISYFVGFSEQDVNAKLEEAMRLQEEALAEAATEETEEPEAEETAPEEVTDEASGEAGDVTEGEDVSPLLGKDRDEEILQGISDGSIQAAVFLDKSYEAIVVLDIAINLLRGDITDEAFIAASGWEFSCRYDEGISGSTPPSFFIEPELITQENLKEMEWRLTGS